MFIALRWVLRLSGEKLLKNPLQWISFNLKTFLENWKTKHIYLAAILLHPRSSALQVENTCASHCKGPIFLYLILLWSFKVIIMLTAEEWFTKIKGTIIKNEV